MAIKQQYLLWVIIGCIIPDLPWIQQKILLMSGAINPYDLRLYFMVQASFAFCLLLSLALASLTEKPVKIFLILAVNCLLHLLLDSLQIKWGNGVHLLAPFNWELFHLDLIWPEHIATKIITLTGIPIVIYNWRTIAAHGLGISKLSRFHLAVSILLVLLYYVSPSVFFDQLEATDSNYIKTMRNVADRPGKIVEFDRVNYRADTHRVKDYSGESFTVEGLLPAKSGRVSLQGYFADTGRVISTNFHMHDSSRDLASILGLFMACALIMHAIILSLRNRSTKNPG